MRVEYVNRRGERYHLLQGKTKTGKPKYYVSRKPEGVAVEAMPEGYEFHENPERGVVTVRKLRPSRLTADERQLPGQVAQRCGLKYVIVDVQGDSLIVWTADRNPEAAASLLGKLFGPLGTSLEAETAAIASMVHYTAMLRFTLIDENRRQFTAERWCFLGGIDDWFPIGKSGPLQTLAEKYLPHVNQESFFELM